MRIKDINQFRWDVPRAINIISFTSGRQIYLVSEIEATEFFFVAMTVLLTKKLHMEGIFLLIIIVVQMTHVSRTFSGNPW